MPKSLKHVGVLGMKWGIRRNSDQITLGGRTTTRGEHKDEAVKRHLALATSKNPHIERKEADLILDRSAIESGKNIHKALNRFAGENDLRSAVKKGYIKAPSKNIMEMSTKEIEHHLNSDPSIREHLKKDFDARAKRGKIIAGTLLATYALIKISAFVVDRQNYAQAINSISNNISSHL